MVEVIEQNSSCPPSLHYGAASASHASARRAEAIFCLRQNQRRRMVEAIEQNSNRLFKTLEQWNDLLQHASVSFE
jgi:hypothetical protein